MINSKYSNNDEMMMMMMMIYYKCILNILLLRILARVLHNLSVLAVEIAENIELAIINYIH